MALFRERGFDRVTVEEICSAADVARGTFFAHFPAKAALLFQFHRAMSARFVQALPQPRGSAVDEIRSLLYAALEKEGVATAAGGGH